LTEARSELILGVFGAGLSSDTGISGGRLFGRFLSFEYWPKTGWDMRLSPLHFSTDIKNKEEFSLTFVNASLFYDFIKSADYVCGVFASASAVNYSRPDFFELRSGLVFLIAGGLIPRPLGRLKPEGAGDLFPRIRKFFKEKSSISRPLG
jgi:hypothetical protein